MKIVEISDEVKQELGVEDDGLDIMVNTLSQHSKFVNDILLEILKRNDIEEFYFNNNNDNGNTVFKMLADKFNDYGEGNIFNLESHELSFFVNFTVVNIMSQLIHAVIEVVARMCEFSKVKSLVLTLKPCQPFEARAVYEE